MPWYDGPSLLELLESLPSSHDTSHTAPFRFPVQRVLRPDHTFRGFCRPDRFGNDSAGRRDHGASLRPTARRWSASSPGMAILNEATAPLSVTLVLDREVDISRGDLIVASTSPATVAKNVTAALVWMDQRPLELNRRYLLKHTSHTVPAFVPSIQHRDRHGHAGRTSPRRRCAMNDIGVGPLQSAATHRARSLSRRIALPAHSS